MKRSVSDFKAHFLLFLLSEAIVYWENKIFDLLCLSLVVPFDVFGLQQFRKKPSINVNFNFNFKQTTMNVIW